MTTALSRRCCPRTASLCSALVITAVVLSGCQSPPRDPDAESAISASVAFQAAVCFTTAGGPLDEPQAADQTLTAAQAVRQAVATDPRIQAALARVRIALADAGQARLLPNPVLNLIIKFPEGGGSALVEAELAGELVAALQTPQRTAAADNRLRAAAAEALTVTLDAVAQVRETYARAQAHERLLGLLNQRLELSVRLESWTDARVGAGEAPRSDATVTQLQRADLDLDIAREQRQLKDARLHLARLIGRPSDSALWTLDPWPAFDPLTAAEAEWIAAAVANRPEINALLYELAALGADADQLRYAPFDTAEAGVKGDRDGSWAAGPMVALPFPVFDNGDARRQRAAAQQAEVRHRVTDARRAAVEDVRRAYASYASATDTLEHARTRLGPLQERRRADVEHAIQAGIADAGALMLAELELKAAIEKRTDLELDAALSLIALERAVGGPAVAATLAHTQEHP